MEIYSTKENALINLNTTYIRAGEIKVYQYYTITGSVESFVAIGIKDGIGPGCYQFISKQKNLIVCIDEEYPDSTRLVQGQIHVCKVGNIYHMIYVEDFNRVDKEILDGEVYYVEDFDTGYIYFLDRHNLKKLDDYYSKVYISLSNSQAVYDGETLPETKISVYKDGIDITSNCSLSILPRGCDATLNSNGLLKLIGLDSNVNSASVQVKAVYGGSNYYETWNIIRLVSGKSGSDAEIYQLISTNSIVRNPDLLSTEISVLYRSGSELSYLPISSLGSHNLKITYQYSDNTEGIIDDSTFNFIYDDIKTYCTIKLSTLDNNIISSITIPYLPNTSAISSGQGIYKSIVFCRSNDVPTKPTGGSWSSPQPVEDEWTTSAQTGSELLWTSSRIFTSNGEFPQDDEWSDPASLGSSGSIEIMYSSCEDAALVGTPSTKPEFWSDTIVGVAYFMATRTIKNGVVGIWQVFPIHGTPGSKADYKNYIYCQYEPTDSKPVPDEPVGSNPVGWYDYPGSSGIWWMSVGLFSGETDQLIGSWSTPTRITGIDGKQGADGPYLVYQYATSVSSVDPPTNVGDWSYIIPTVTKGKFLWQRTGTVTPPETEPRSWNKPVRITGEKGDTGAPGTSIHIDLTNEVSCVPASYEGVIPSGTVFEESKVLVFENNQQLSLGSSRISSKSIKCTGIEATFDENSGIIRPTSWLSTNSQDTASISVSIVIDEQTYTATYTIVKIKAGSPGEDGKSVTMYSLLTSTDTIRKVANNFSSNTISVTVKKTTGDRCTIIDGAGNFSSEGLVVKYTTNITNNIESVYSAPVRVTQGLEVIVFKLYLNNVMIDQETVSVIETNIDLIVDLTNQVSAIAANEDGTISPDTIFETSTVSAKYGNEIVNLSNENCTVELLCNNVSASLDRASGVIRLDTGVWENTDEDTGSVLVSVTYEGITKTVTYTIVKVRAGAGGEAAITYKLLPEASTIKKTSTGYTVGNTLEVNVLKTQGLSRSEYVASEYFTNEGIRLTYVYCYVTGQNSIETDYRSSGIQLQGLPEDLNEIKLNLYYNGSTLIDQESIPVVYDGINAYSINVDLTNENSSVVADENGIVPNGAVIEGTQLLVYRNGQRISDLSNYITELSCSGVTASIDKYGVVTVDSWTDKTGNRTSASVEISIEIDNVRYSAIYSISKVCAGASGESVTIYSILPSTNLIRKFNSKLDIQRVYIYIKKTTGSEVLTISNPSEYGLVLKYSINGEDYQIYNASGISITQDTERISTILYNSEGTEIDRETVLVVESALDLVVNLDNTNSSIAVASDGSMTEYSVFETSTVSVFYGSEPVNINDTKSTISWKGISGTFVDGVITPTRWVGTEDTASATVTVKYQGITKIVIYTITRVKAGSDGTDGQAATIWKIMPDVTSIRATERTVGVSAFSVSVLKFVGNNCYTIYPNKFNEEHIRLTYTRIINNSSEAESVYNNYIPVIVGTNRIDIALYDTNGNVLDKESVPVVCDGTSYYSVRLDLTNENSVIICDNNGIPVDTIEDTYINLYRNSDIVDLNSLPDTNINISWNNLRGSFNKSNGKFYNITWDESKYRYDTGSIEVKVKYDGITYTKIYSVTKVRQGENGVSPVIYSILPSSNAIISDQDSRTVSEPQLTVTVVKHTTEGTTQLSKSGWAAEGIEVVYRIDNSTYYSIYDSYIPINYTNKQVELGIRYIGKSDLIDREIVPIIKNGATGAPANWVSYIFCEKETKPSTPSFDHSPYDGERDSSGDIWRDGPSGSDENIWWMSKATIDGTTSKLLAGTGWSEPFKATGTDGSDGTAIECQYTNSKNLITPPVGAVWEYYATQPEDGYYTWMRIRTLNPEGEWSYIRVTGEKGNDGSGISIQGDLNYVGSHTSSLVAETWAIIGDGEYTEGMTNYSGILYYGLDPYDITKLRNGDCFLYSGYLFVCTGKNSDTGISTWQLTHIKGDPGESYMTYVAFSKYSDGRDYIPSDSHNWDSSYKYMGIATLPTSEYGTFPINQPNLFKPWVRTAGEDGIGVEFIYALSNSNQPPSINYSYTYVVGGETITRDSDEFLPPGWTDNPSPVTENDPIQWVSKRIKKNGEWQNFSTPVIWNRFVKDGTSINIKGVLKDVSNTAGNDGYGIRPALNTNFVPGNTNSVVGFLFYDGNKVTDVANGDTYTYEGYFFICSGFTTSSGTTYPNWSIMAAKGEPGVSQYLFVRYASDDQGHNISSSWSVGLNYVGYFISEDGTTIGDQPVSGWIKFTGQDGVGNEFIFSTKSDPGPSNPHNIPISTQGFQTDDYLPRDYSSDYNDWTADPQEVNEFNPVQYISYRKKINGEWKQFSEPKVWSRYAKDGTSISIKGVLNSVGINAGSGNYIKTTEQYIEGSTTTIHGALYINNTNKSDVVNGDTYTYGGYFFICADSYQTISGVPYYTWTVMKAKGDDGKSYTVFIRYSPDENHNTIHDTYQTGDIYIGISDPKEASSILNISELHWYKFVGQDGVGYEFIFFRNNDSSTPPTINSTTADTHGKTANDDGYLPKSNDGISWTDDPVEVDINNQIQWVSNRKKVGGSWGNFSTPVIWNRFVKDGTSIKVKGHLDHIGTGNYNNGSFYILTEYNIDVDSNTRTITGTLKKDGNDVSVSNGDAYIYRSYFLILSDITDQQKYIWSVMDVEGVAGNSIYTAYATTTNAPSQDSDVLTEWPTNGDVVRWVGISNPTNVNPGKTITNYRWTKFIGQDGIGHEYIYCVTQTNSDPTDISQLSANQADNYVPNPSNTSNAVSETWHDEPQSLDNVTNQYQWISHRKKDGNGIWSNFSKPVLWSRYPKDGTSIEVKGILDSVKRTSGTTNYIITFDQSITDSFDWDSCSSISGKLFLNGTQVTNTNMHNGDTYAYGGYFFICSGQTSGSLEYYDWTVMKAKGADGTPGKSYHIYIAYSVNNNTADVPSLNDSNNTNWGTSWNTRYKYIGITNPIEDANQPTNKSAYNWSRFAGKDGVGIEYIYKVTRDNYVPTLVTSSNGNNYSITELSSLSANIFNTIVGNTSGSYTFQTDEFYPRGWSDDPISLEKGDIQWMSYRKKIDDAWTDFSTPVIWSSRPEDGTGIAIKGTLDGVIDRSISIPDSGTYLSITRGNVDDYISNGVTYGNLYIDGTINESLVSGDTYTYNGYFFIFSGRNGSNYAWTTMEAKGEPGESYKLSIRYAETIDEEDSEMTETWYPGCKYIGIYYHSTTNEEDNTGEDNKSNYSWTLFVGEDGAGVEYIYSYTRNTDITGLTTGAYYTVSGERHYFQNDEFIPNGSVTNGNGNTINCGNWFDNPLSPSDAIGEENVYISSRKKVNGVWQSFSTPTIWARYTKDGSSITMKGRLGYIGQGNNEINQLGTSDYFIFSSDDYINSSSISGTLYQGNSTSHPITNVKIGDSYSYSGYLFTNTGANSNGTPTWVSSYLKGDSTYIHIAFSTSDNNNDTSFFAKYSESLDLSQYKYIGICSNNEEDDSGLSKSDYKWSLFKGEDGIGVEFIFTRTNSEVWGSSDPNPNISYNDNNTFQNDGHIPYRWYDDPQGVNKTNKVEWVSSRKKVNGVWQSFSSPAVWARYAEDGTSISVKGTLNYVGESNNRPGDVSDNYLIYSSGNSGSYAQSSTIYVGSYVINSSNNVNFTTGDTYAYDGYFFIYSGIANNASVWTVMAAKGDPGDSMYVHIVYATNSNGLNKNTNWSEGYNYIAYIVNTSESFSLADVPPTVTWHKFIGEDGPGVEYIYSHTDNNSITTLTTGAHFTDDFGGQHTFQEDEFCPKGSVYTTDSGSTQVNCGVWYDDPIEVSQGEPYVYISSRKKYNGLWSQFSEPKLWAKYAKDGTSIEIKGILTYVGSSNNQNERNRLVVRSDYSNYQTLSTIYSPTNGNGGLYIEGIKETDKTTGDTYAYDGYFFVYSGTSTVAGLGTVDAWTVIKAKGEQGTPGTSYYVYTLYASSNNPQTYQTDWDKTWRSGFNYIAIVTRTDYITINGSALNSLQIETSDWHKFIGEDGPGVEYIYTSGSNSDKNSIANLASYTFNGAEHTYLEDEFCPKIGTSNFKNSANVAISVGTWFDNPISPTIEDQEVYVSSRHKPTGGQWQQFSVPVLWSRYGIDGPGVEYIYAYECQELDPEGNYSDITELGDDNYYEYYTDGNNEIHQLENGNNVPTGYTKYRHCFQDDEFCPNGEVVKVVGNDNSYDNYGPWFDNPQEVDINHQILWISSRKKVNGVWGKFSTPIIYKKYQPELVYNLVLDSESDTTSFSNYVSSNKRLAIVPGSTASDLRQICDRARNGLGGFTKLHYYDTIQNDLTGTRFTIEKNNNVEVHIFYYDGISLGGGDNSNGVNYTHESFSSTNSTGVTTNSTSVNTTIKEAIIISLCEDLSVTTWSIKITSNEGISKTYTVSRDPIQIKSNITKLQINADLSDLSTESSIILSAYQNNVLIENSNFSRNFDLFFKIDGLAVSNGDTTYPLFCLSRGAITGGYTYSNDNATNKVNLSFSKQSLIRSIISDNSDDNDFVVVLRNSGYDSTYLKSRLKHLIENGTKIVFYLIPKYEVSISNTTDSEYKLLYSDMLIRNSSALPPNAPYIYGVSKDFNYPIKAEIELSSLNGNPLFEFEEFDNDANTHRHVDSGWMIDKSNIYCTSETYKRAGNSSVDESGSTNLTYNNIRLYNLITGGQSIEYQTIIEPNNISVKHNDATDSGSNNKSLINISSNSIELYSSDLYNSNVSIQSDGNITATGTISSSGSVSSSDVRLKSNITDLEDRGSLRPVSYIKDGKEGIGFIAQEVQEKYPELVLEDNTENHYLYLNYPQITAVLQAQVNTLRKEIEILKEEIKQLKKNK